jgi:pimeloyl-ACP methyl ester carboxylesterase
MQGRELRGTKLRGTEVIKVEKQELETIILDVRRESMDGFEFVQIETSRGRVDCKYYKARETDKGVIMVGGIGEGFQTPSDSLYPRLCADLKEIDISSLNLKFRNPKDLAESVIDILVGIEFLKSENVRVFGLIGYSFGGAVVVQAAFNEKNVKTIVMLSTQGLGVSPISLLPKETSVFLIHGEEDEIIPPDVSVLAYDLAHEPKRIEIYDTKAGHSLDEVSDEIYVEVKDWIVKNLKGEPNMDRQIV